jgi:hypothetical protein
MVTTLLAILTVVLVYWFPVRRGFARWGTTRDDRTRVMSGDRVIANPTHIATHAITVHAPPECIWPWLVQLGYQRGGLYSYDWLDRLFGILDGPSANRILPEFQELAVGDAVPLGPRESLTVAVIEPYRALVLRYGRHDFEWVWQFGLYPIDGDRTRLVTRGAERVPRSLASWCFMRVMEPAAFIMTRKMLLGVKHRAERLRSSSPADHDGRQAAAA